MASSKDSREYSVGREWVFNCLLGLLPQVYLRVSPYEAYSPVIEAQNLETGQIKLRVQPESETPAYKFTLTCEAIDSNRSRVRAEAITYGVTDLGLGQLTLRQLLITLKLAAVGRLGAGQLPVFFIERLQPPTGSPQARAEAQANTAFDQGRRGYAEDALKSFRASLAINSHQPEIYYHMGVLEMLMGRLAEAAQMFQSAAGLEPNHLLAGAYLADLQTRIQKVGPEVSSPFTMPTRTTPLAPNNNTPMNSAAYNLVSANPASSGQLKTPAPELATMPAPRNSNNEDRVATRPIQLLSGGWLFLRGDGAPVAEYRLIRPVTTLGRSETSDILLMDAKVSRHHAEILYNPSKRANPAKTFTPLLRDLGSINGTYLNGRRLTPREEVWLQHGDRLGLGEIEIIYIAANPLQK